ncbi:MAG: AbrB/MazE/SpoVT family DNA-binding domain-containing protein [Chloroflexota bacterium]|nr:AbrB/MazE/SpoVT family DNA-binding domain-containing protein [Chloroflexota bacterium]
MSNTMTVRLAQRGVMTIPKQLRETYNIKYGDYLTLTDLGGVFMVSPKQSEVDIIADSIQETLIEKGETLESMLKALREVRDQHDAQV